MKRDSEHLTNLHEDMGLRVLSVVPRRRLGLAALNAVVAALVLFAPRFVPAVEAQTPANDAATFTVTATPSAVPEGESATVTVAISNGVPFEADQTITLAVSGTASSDDYEVKPKSLRLTLPAGETSATVELEGLEDNEEEEAETVTFTASHGGVVIGSATVTITSISHDATLSALSLSGIDIGTFSGAETSYTVYVEEAVETTTVTATASHPEAEVSIEPGAEVSLEAGDNEMTVTVTAADGVTTETYTVTVFRHIRLLTAFFLSPPVSHVGSGTFSLRVVFSEPVSTNFRTLKEQSFQVINGEVRNARRVSRSDLWWDIEVAPSSTADVAVMLPPTTDCAAAGAVCTESGKPLSNRLTVLIPGPPNTRATGLPSISGTARVGQTLTADTSDVTDPDGLPNSFTYQWQRFAANGTTFEANIGTNANTCTLTSAEAGKRIKVRVTFTDGGGTEETILSGATAMVAEPLTASFSNMPESHDGSTAFTFDLHFSEDIKGLSYRTVRDALLDVSGARVTKAPRLARGSNQDWRVTVQPAGARDIAISLPARACGETGAVCTADGWALWQGISATVKKSTRFLASFDRIPRKHDGETPFTFSLWLSREAEGLSDRTVRDALLDVRGARVTNARRLVRGSNRVWEVTVAPTSTADIDITVRGTESCEAPHAVCTLEGQKLPGGPGTTIPLGLSLSVADAEVREGPDAALDFTVNLSRTTNKQITVYYRTYDGTATAGADYEATNGTVVFTPGETEKTISVAVLDDAHDEGTETVNMWLYGVRGLSAAQVTDPYATGTIVNSDPLQRAWLARFGRTVATHVTDAVGERLRTSPGQGSHVTVGGYRLPLDKPVAGEATPATGDAGTAPGEGTGPDSGLVPRLGRSQPPTLDFDLRRLLLGSSFRLSLGAQDAGASTPRLTAWGRFAGTTFDGRDGDLSMDGDVFTGTVGVDSEWDRLLAGISVAHSRGEGAYTMTGAGAGGQGGLEHTLTSLHPYLRYAVTDRLDVWGLFGYGWGQWELETDHGETLETGTTLVMGAFGSRGILRAAPESGGFQLATRTDAMLTRTTSDAVAGMVAGEADAHRLRLVLEGTRAITWTDGQRLTPTMEVGLRHDWGDAETGFGLELGSRVQYADPALGLTIEAAVRGLLAHEDRDYEEWGASGTVRLDPGASGRGLSLTLAPTWGAASSGVDGLWSRQTTAGLAPSGTRRAQAGRLNAEVGYGFAPFDTGLLTPFAGTVLAEGADRTYRVGTRLQFPGHGVKGFKLSLEGQRQEASGPQPVNQGLRLQAEWQF